MNRLTEALLQESASGRVRLHDKALRDLLPPAYAESYGELQLGRPLLVPQAGLVDFADDLVRLFGILTGLPDRCFDGDLRRYGRALGLDPRLLELVTLGATGRPPLYARADAFHDGESFRLLELNVGSELGGIDTAQLNRAFLGIETFSEFARRHDLAFVDTSELLAGTLRRAGQAVGTDDPVVALVEGRGGLAEHWHVFTAIREALAGHGIRIHLTEIDRLGTRSGRLILDGTPIDVVLRYFAADQLPDPADLTQLRQIMDAHAAGRTAVFTPLEGALFGSKASLGLLHDPRIRDRLTATERAVVERRVPWTRLLAGAPDRGELWRRCRAERRSLVLKPGLGYGATGVVIGERVSDQEWLDHLAAGERRDFVVQRRVIPAAEPVLDVETGAIEDWHANWGVFVTDSGYSGAFVRALRPRDGSIISYSNPGTRGTCVFTYPRSGRR